MLKDGKFLLITCAVIITLIWIDYPWFLKSLVSQNIANQKIKQAAEDIKIEGIRKQEQNFWNNIKEVNSEPEDTLPEIPIEKTENSPSKPTTKTTKIIKSNKPEKPYRKFLFIGDSIIYEIAIATQNTLLAKYNIKSTKLDYKISTGLNRIDYYNWYDRTSKLLKTYQPDVLIVMFGGNDDQDIKDFNGKYSTALSEPWKKAYQQRVEKYAKLINTSSVRKIYWIGQPITSKSRYNTFFPIFNKIYKQVSQNYPKIQFISTWELLSTNDKFVPILPNKIGKKGYIKTADGVHFTPHGASIVVDKLIQQMEKDKILKTPPQKKPTPPQKP